MQGCGCSTLGGAPTFEPLGVGSIENRGSTNNQGRHGASNRWSQWPKRGSSTGITARAPYNIGNPKTPNTIGGNSRHSTGLDLGIHGHGVGVVPASIGGAHNKRTLQLAITHGQEGGAFLTPAGGRICIRCLSTWVFVGAVILVLMLTGVVNRG
jgi:hypothetical protein